MLGVWKEGEIDGVKGFDKDGNSNLEIGLELARREEERKANI